MKLYVWHKAPNPRRVLIYLAEKGIEVPLEDVGGDKARLKPQYVARYPQAIVEMWEAECRRSTWRPCPSRRASGSRRYSAFKSNPPASN